MALEEKGGMKSVEKKTNRDKSRYKREKKGEKGDWRFFGSSRREGKLKRGRARKRWNQTKKEVKTALEIED